MANRQHTPEAFIEKLREAEVEEPIRPRPAGPAPVSPPPPRSSQARARREQHSHRFIAATDEQYSFAPSGKFRLFSPDQG